MTQTIIEILITSAVLILALALVRKLFSERINPRFMYALWLIVPLRLFIPVSIQSAFSMMNAVQPAADGLVQGISTPIVPTAPPVNAGDALNAAATRAPVTSAAPTAASTLSSLNWLDALVAVWLIGVAAMLVYTVIVNIIYHRRMLAGATTLECSQMLSDLNVRRNVRVVVSPNVAGPCLISVFRPRIVVTPEIAADTKYLEYALMHEASHLRQGDNVWALVRNLTCVAYWFNPFVWMAAALSRKDCELACDARVVKSLDKERRLEYGEALISIIRVKQEKGRARL